MPIVSVQLFPGRTTVMKEFLSRAIVDAVSEIAGPARDAVHVIFKEVPTNEWAIGPSLVSSRPPSPPIEYVPALIATERVTLLEARRSDYVTWCREALFPFLASQQGFLSSTLIAIADAANELLIVEKWTSQEARDRSASQPRAAELREERAQFVAALTVEDLAGLVVDVFHGRA